jgi:hypothetical protein
MWARRGLTVATVVAMTLFGGDWKGMAAAPSKTLVFEGTVISIGTIENDLKRWLITVTVTKVLSGEFFGSTFEFVVHSPSRSGLEKGRSYTIEAVWNGKSYTVDENQWRRRAAPPGAELLEGERWQALALITRLRSLQHKKSGFEARLLEADGSASVAQDPVGLYLVVTNNGTSEGVEHIWRLRRGVARVKSLVATPCGIDVRVDVDRITAELEVRGTIPLTLRLCFLDPKGGLEKQLKVSEVSR